MKFYKRNNKRALAGLVFRRDLFEDLTLDVGPKGEEGADWEGAGEQGRAKGTTGAGRQAMARPGHPEGQCQGSVSVPGHWAATEGYVQGVTWSWPWHRKKQGGVGKRWTATSQGATAMALVTPRALDKVAGSREGKNQGDLIHCFGRMVATGIVGKEGVLDSSWSY